MDCKEDAVQTKSADDVFSMRKKLVSNNGQNYICDSLEIFDKMVNFYSIFKDQNTVLIFDLLPGVGKTLQVHNLVTYLNSKNKVHSLVRVVAPTARATLLYQEEDVKATTLHSLFKINPNEGRSWTQLKELFDAFFAKNKYVEVLVVDEFSMVGCQLIYFMVDYFLSSGKFLVLLGDSCQLRPVNQKAFNPISFSKNSKHSQNMILFSCGPEIILYRFVEDIRQKITRFLFYLRQLIMAEKNKKENKSNKSNKTSQTNEKSTAKNSKRIVRTITADALEMWLECFSLFDIVEHPLNDEFILKDLERVQRDTNTKILECRFDEVMDMPVVIGFQNDYSIKIQKNIFKNVENFDEKDSIEGVFNVYIDYEDYLSKADQLCKTFKDKNLPSIFFNNDICLRKGTYMVCRRNNKRQNVFNGLRCIYLERKINYGKILFKKQIGDSFWVNVVEDISKFDCQLTLFNCKTKTVFNYRPEDVFFCELCKQGKCSHDNSILTTKVFFMHAYYSITLYNLQGMTLEDPIICNTEEIFKRDILITLYVLLSRERNPKNIMIDHQFILKALRTIFGLSSFKALHNKILKDNKLTTVLKNFNISF